MVEVGKVFLISNCSLKPANRQYSNIKNDYEITFRDITEVVACTDDTSDVPSITFNFVRIADLNSGLKDQVVDIVGICRSASEVATITSQKLNKVGALLVSKVIQQSKSIGTCSSEQAWVTCGARELTVGKIESYSFTFDQSWPWYCLNKQISLLT